jgi:hypothetical protein
MLSLEAAKEIAVRRVAEIGRACGDDLVLRASCVETDIAWAFFYDTRAYLERGDEGAHLYGNGPLIVRKSDGALYEAGTAFGVEYYLDNLAKYGSVLPPEPPLA